MQAHWEVAAFLLILAIFIAYTSLVYGLGLRNGRLEGYTKGYDDGWMARVAKTMARIKSPPSPW